MSDVALLDTESKHKTFQRVLDELSAVRETRAISQRGGKKYLMVVDRVDALRRNFSDYYSVETEILKYATVEGEPVVLKATVKDPTGRVIATGHAEEIRSDRGVNATSAIENAETSAIGRALASLGLHGGEYASSDELDGVGRKENAKAAHKTIEHKASSDPLDDDEEDEKPAPKQASKAKGEQTDKHADVTPEQWEAARKTIMEAIEKLATTQKLLVETWKENIKSIEGMEKHAPEEFAILKKFFVEKNEAFKAAREKKED